MKSLLLLFSILYMNSLQADALTPNSENCDYYYEVENQYNCGKKGYPLKFGFRMCELYKKAEPKMPERVKEWFPKVRLCLQQFIHDNQFFSEKSCKDLRKAALNSHVKCYEDTGYCQLSFSDKLKIIEVTSTNMFSTSILSMAFKVESSCHGKKKKKIISEESLLDDPAAGPLLEGLDVRQDLGLEDTHTTEALELPKKVGLELSVLPDVH